MLDFVSAERQREANRKSSRRRIDRFRQLCDRGAPPLCLGSGAAAAGKVAGVTVDAKRFMHIQHYSARYVSAAAPCMDQLGRFGGFRH